MGSVYIFRLPEPLQNESLEKKLTKWIISPQLSQAGMDSTLNGSPMKGEFTCQEYFKGIYMLKGNNW